MMYKMSPQLFGAELSDAKGAAAVWAKLSDV